MTRLTEKQAWSLIEQMGWGRSSQNYKVLAREWYAKLGKTGMKALENFVGSRVSDLYHAVEKYEATGKDLEIVSDDGMSDLIHHVVGLGKVEFERNLAEPYSLARRYASNAYTESFAYCFQEPEPPRTQAQKDQAAENLQKGFTALQSQFSTLQAEWNKFETMLDQLAITNSIVQMDKKTA